MRSQAAFSLYLRLNTATLRRFDTQTSLSCRRLLGAYTMSSRPSAVVCAFVTAGKACEARGGALGAINFEAVLRGCFDGAGTA